MHNTHHSNKFVELNSFYNKLQTTNGIIPFMTLSFVGLLSPFMNSWGAFPASDFLFSISYFTVVLALQFVVVSYVGSLWKQRIEIQQISYLILLIFNLFYFAHVLTSDSAILFLGVTATFSAIFLVGIFSKNSKKIIFIFAVVHVVIWTYELAGSYMMQNKIEVSTSQNNSNSKSINTAQRSVYVIGIDSMVSQQSMKELFNHDQSVAYKWLGDNGFDLYDKQSPGDQTLTTFGAMLQQSTSVHPRTVRKIFNGQVSSKLYAQLAELKFSRQFFYMDDYFGTDVGQIESFIPKSQSLNFCYYADDRWGYYFCRMYKYFRKGSDSNMSSSVNSFYKFYTENVRIEKNIKWFSIHHIWFPGHTIGKYDGKIFADRDAFRRYYVSSQKDLTVLLEKITSYIKKNDENAVIVFFGDHGAYLLKHVTVGAQLNEFKNVTPEDINLDARGVLLAVYPKNFCKERLETMDQTKYFLKNIAECASQ